MERRFLLFVVLMLGVILANAWLMSTMNPQAPPQLAEEAAPAEKPEEDRDSEPAVEQGAPGTDDASPEQTDPEKPKPGVRAGEDTEQRVETGPAEQPEESRPDEAPDEPPAAGPAPPAGQAIPETHVTLGSIDPASPYRMLVTLTNRGAAVLRIELNSPDFRDLEYRGGYLGHVVVDQKLRGKGCPVQIVAPGTPAEKAGLQKGDVITSLAGHKVTGAISLRKALDATEPDDVVPLDILREGRPKELEVVLGRRPLELVRPEGDDPLSLLTTLHQVDESRLAVEIEDYETFLKQELPGVNLRQGTWKLVEATTEAAVFRRVFSDLGIELTKRYRLAEVPAGQHDNPVYEAYHLVLDLEIRNIDQQPHEVAYQLDGPTGLPVEGWWYANKVGRSWGAVGLRDVVVTFSGNEPKLIGAPEIAEEDVIPPWKDESLGFIGVDAQYFSAILIPQKEKPETIWIAESRPIRVGPVDEERVKLTDTSCRLVSEVAKLQPGQSLRHSYRVFAGPKRPALMARYGLDGIVYYGWFSFIAVPMLHLLHFFHSFVFNYGIAIIMLTVVVRSIMFPLSRKQALNAQKMAELQPEIKRIQEKYKKDMEARTKAQQELFRKHNYNPLSGCLPMFIQLPIFIALYRSLMVDIELRQAPLITSSIRWCSNLAAPDMLFDWSSFMPEFVTNGVGMLGLGPYFNILPLVTVALFIVQQKMFMPPPADEQAAMQQKMMQYMMIFFGVLFFKVASGLCIYFIASSLWGVAERKWLPKPKPAGTQSQAKADEGPISRLREAIRPGGDGDNGAATKKRKKTKGKR